MKSTAELVEIVFNLQMQQKAAWTQYLSSGYEQMRINSVLYRDAADAINEFIDREDRQRKAEALPLQAQRARPQAEPVAWLQPGTLNACDPERFAELRAGQHTSDYDDWFPVAKIAQPQAELRSMSRSQLMRLRGEIAEILLERLDESKTS
jgi:hypothetical protein